MLKTIYILVGFAVILAMVQFVVSKDEAEVEVGEVEEVAGLAADVEEHIASKADLIVLDTPAPESVITSPLSLAGMARGYWYFEASFPITLTNWDGLIIAEGYATASGDWMTEDFVPFTASLEFTSPYSVGDPDFMKNGTLILQKDNPSDLPENDDALEIPVRFAL